MSFDPALEGSVSKILFGHIFLKNLKKKTLKKKRIDAKSVHKMLIQNYQKKEL